MLRNHVMRLYYMVWRMDQRIRRRMTTRGNLFLCFAIISMLLTPGFKHGVAYIIFPLFATPLLVGLLGCRLHRPKLMAKRQLPPYCTVSSPLSYEVIVTNVGQSTVRHLEVRESLAEVPDCPGEKTTPSKSFRQWFEQLQWRLGAACRSANCIKPLHPGQSVTLHLQLESMRRGAIAMQKLELLSAEPLGLCHSVAIIDAPDNILSLPRRHDTAALTDQGGGGKNYGSGAAGGIGSTNEFIYLRNYVPGDPIRHMHWPSLARHEQPIVQQLESIAPLYRVLLLDVAAKPDFFEQTVSVAASLVAPYAGTKPQSINMLAAGAVQVRGDATSRNTAEAMLVALASVRCNGSLATVQQAALAMAPQAEQILLLCSDWDNGRQKLCQKLQIHCKDFRVLYISDTVPEETIPQLQHLDANNIAAALAAMKL